MVYSLFGPIDAVLAQPVLEAPLIAYVLLGLLVLNMVGRAVEHSRHKSEAESGDWTQLSRHPLRVATSFLLVVGSFYYLTVAPHGGMVFSVLVLGVFLTDLFEFESRQVEVRNDRTLDTPKGAIAASVLALLYILYQTLFFVIAPVWNAVI
ncbi:DUF7313 family protein [Halosegnis marinus]|uniref:DUF7313 domain-containing protein n=1 Tax=Halosegnis marinus TaxID=3034023 RepID=A0ABD5ZRH8_9EURY|nr:hypothetical protein [Halosegnis sp. DT85]